MKRVNNLRIDASDNMTMTYVLAVKLSINAANCELRTSIF